MTSRAKILADLTTINAPGNRRADHCGHDMPSSAPGPDDGAGSA
jgi:hypothetical protein